MSNFKLIIMGFYFVQEISIGLLKSTSLVKYEI